MTDLRYREDRFFSVLYGGDAVRVAIFDTRGREHARIVPHARPWKERRNEVIAELETELVDRA